MRVLATTFKILTLCGCWRPTVYSSIYQRFFYIGYAIFLVLLVHTLTISQFMDMVINVDNSDDFIDSSYTFMAMFIACCKMISLLVNRSNIASLENEFLRDPFEVDLKEETEIHERFESFIRKSTLRYIILIETTAMSFNVTSFVTDYTERILPFRAWVPYNYTSSKIFFFTCLHQMSGWGMGALLHIATDALICGFLMHTCCQFEVLECRLKRIRNQGDQLRKCVKHHDRIYKFASDINETFRTMIFVQFLVSTLTVCLILCQMVKIKGLTAKVVQMLLYMASMLTQIFLYCWCGNEVKLKSLRISNTIFELDWPNLNENVKKMLIMIMRRGRVPIEFTSAYIVTMNLDSFVSILKASYSAYNLLQRTQSK